MSKDIKENSKQTDETVDEVIEETKEDNKKESQEETKENNKEENNEESENGSKKEQEEADEEDALAKLAMEKEAKRLAKQEKKEAKRAAKLVKKEEKLKKKDEDTSENSADVADDEEAVKKKKKKSKEPKNPEDINIVSELLNLIIYIGIVVLICYFVINFVGCRSRVDGDSMNPTLEDGDNLWVDKLSYTFGDPDRFDVIIFNYNEDTTYVKRIIGLPGETVRIDISGNIYINNKLLVESYGNEVIKPTNIGRANVDVVLGKGEYFVLGDNRNNSSDSRWPDVGNVHEDDILGKVILRIYPFTSIGTIK